MTIYFFAKSSAFVKYSTSLIVTSLFLIDINDINLVCENII